MNKGKFFYFFIALFLTGCSSVPLKRLSPEPYTRASDFASAIMKQTTCMGHIESFILKPGESKTDEHGVLTFTGNYSDIYCNAEDFREVIETYCNSKGGTYRGDWCVRNYEPVFRIEKFTIQEKSESLTEAQWQQVARAHLGYVSEKEYQLEQERKDANSLLLKQQRETRLHSKVRASVGDFICREDLQANGEYYQGPVYYGAYVEGNKNGRLKLRVVWHGRKDMDIVNSKQNEAPVIWEAPEGWFKCDRQVIQNLP